MTSDLPLAKNIKCLAVGQVSSAEPLRPGQVSDAEKCCGGGGGWKEFFVVQLGGLELVMD